MKRLFYALRFDGKVLGTDGEPDRLRTNCTATSCVHHIVMGPDALSTHQKACDGDLAFLESTLDLTVPGCFDQRGTITFGSGEEHELQFLP